jgi:hypothetical protein
MVWEVCGGGCTGKSTYTASRNTTVLQQEDQQAAAWGAKAKENLSLYGISSVDELIAESVAQNVLGIPGILAQQVIMILLE